MADTLDKADGRSNAAANLMLTGTVLPCPDCADDRIFVAPEAGDAIAGDYCCTDCRAAVSVEAQPPSSSRNRSASRVA